MKSLLDEKKQKKKININYSGRRYASVPRKPDTRAAPLAIVRSYAEGTTLRFDRQGRRAGRLRLAFAVRRWRQPLDKRQPPPLAAAVSRVGEERIRSLRFYGEYGVRLDR
jgi:hypothetical protein